ncbi:hypothetical protein [Collinsella intestinalis]|uniref:VgrG-related protein n=1 Tax=Collinsella intestinalis TaxID=147207 RepID=UPI00195EB3F6|nr:hypothetical protein [Collinsella intestinalis]MBM6683396.1 hypothetical protein [Collinsella intestinalis]
MKPRHLAVAAGLALTLSLGAAQAAAPVYAEEAPVEHDADAAAQPEAASSADTDVATAEDEPAVTLPAPSDYDKTDFCEDAAVASTLSARSLASSLSSVSVSAEMKYFTKYESHSNYRQGFGSGDGYNALGYYQFDRRYSLVPFLSAVYSTKPSKYAMLKTVVDRGSEIKSAASMYDKTAGTLTELGRTVQNAWYAAYDADPAEFSAFQDAYAYNSYYLPTERWLKSELGIDMSGRSDCVKGMVWGLSNLWGTGGVKKVLRGANLRNDMTDRELVTALATQMTDNIAQYSSQTQYYKGWRNRYRNELNDCLAYISLHETNAGSSDAPAGDAGTGEGSAGSAGDTAGGIAPENDAVSDGSASGGQSGSGDSAGSEDDAVVDDAVQGDAAANGGAGDGNASNSSNSGANGILTESAPAGDAGGADEEESASDEVVRPSVTPSQPAPAPSAPSGNTTTEGSDVPSADDAADVDGASDEDAKVDEQVDGAQGAEESVEPTTESQDEEQEETSSPSDEELTRAGEDDSIDEKSDPAQQTENDDTNDDASGDDAKQANRPSGNLPQTADLALVAGFVGASAAVFGATFVYAGKTGLIKREDRKSE